MDDIEVSDVWVAAWVNGDGSHILNPDELETELGHRWTDERIPSHGESYTHIAKMIKQGDVVLQAVHWAMREVLLRDYAAAKIRPSLLVFLPLALFNEEDIPDGVFDEDERLLLWGRRPTRATNPSLHEPWLL